MWILRCCDSDSLNKVTLKDQIQYKFPNRIKSATCNQSNCLVGNVSINHVVVTTLIDRLTDFLAFSPFCFFVTCKSSNRTIELNHALFAQDAANADFASRFYKRFCLNQKLHPKLRESLLLFWSSLFFHVLSLFR